VSSDVIAAETTAVFGNVVRNEGMVTGVDIWDVMISRSMIKEAVAI
jgi:hypothetical protein